MIHLLLRLHLIMAVRKHELMVYFSKHYLLFLLLVLLECRIKVIVLQAYSLLFCSLILLLKVSDPRGVSNNFLLFLIQPVLLHHHVLFMRVEHILFKAIQVALIDT